MGNEARWQDTRKAMAYDLIQILETNPEKESYTTQELNKSFASIYLLQIRSNRPKAGYPASTEQEDYGKTRNPPGPLSQSPHCQLNDPAYEEYRTGHTPKAEQCSK